MCLYLIYEYCFTYIIHCEIQRKTLNEWFFLCFASSTVQKFLEINNDDPSLLSVVTVHHVRTCVFCACSRHVCVLLFFIS